MEQVNEILSLIINILQEQSKNKTFLEWMVYISPAIQSIGLVVAGFWVVYRYNKEKNIEIYSKILNEVYTPLYEYLVRQEMVRKLLKMEKNYKEEPILEVTETLTKIKHDFKTGDVQVTKETNPILLLNREEFIKMLDKVNTGLAPNSLITLLSEYQVVLDFEKRFEKELDDAYLTSTIIKIDIENRLRKEIISGYKRFASKLGIKSRAKAENFKMNEDQIEIYYEVSEEEKEKLKKELQK